MRKQTNDNNAILRYYAKIESGDILANKKIRKVYEHLAKKVKGEIDEYTYCPERAKHIIDFYEKYLRHSKGKWGGQKIKLELWQKAMLSAGWGFVDENRNRQYRRVILFIPKKNGKSFLSSGVGLYHLTADGEHGAEVYSVATKRDQAKIIWEESKRMRNKSPSLKRRLRTTVSGLFFDQMESFYKPLGSNTDTLDGLNISCALLDEVHQWRNNGIALYDIIADGVSAREQPMIMITSTAGTVRNGIYDSLYQEAENIILGYAEENGYKDATTLPVIYELDNKDDWKNPEAWSIANPNLGISKSFKYLHDKVERAKNNPRSVRNLKCKEFNIPETEQTALFDFEEINNTAQFTFKNKNLIITSETEKEIITEKWPRPDYGIGGYDLSVRGDLTAAVVIFMLPGDDRVFCLLMFWMPEDVVEERIKSDKAPYDKWIEQGYIRVCPGNQVDYKMVKQWFVEIRDKHDIYLPWIGYDPAYAAYLTNDLKQEFGEHALTSVRQGFLTLGMPMATLIKKFKAKQVVYNNNPVMKWNLICVTAEEDRNGNLMPSKRQKGNQRIDGFAALLDAWVVAENNMDQYQTMIQN